MNNLIIIFTGTLGVVLTFIVSHELKQGPVRASAGLSLLVGLFIHFFPSLLPNELTTSIPYVFIGASFIGMVSAEVLDNYFFLALSGAVFSIIYLNTSQLFNGYGGALGTTACISLLVSLSISIYSGKLKSKIKRKSDKINF